MKLKVYTNPKKLEGIDNIQYDLKGNIYFTTKDDNPYQITQDDLLELVYALYDSLGLPYTEPERLEDLITKEE